MSVTALQTVPPRPWRGWAYLAIAIAILGALGADAAPVAQAHPTPPHQREPTSAAFGILVCAVLATLASVAMEAYRDAGHRDDCQTKLRVIQDEVLKLRKRLGDAPYGRHPET